MRISLALIVFTLSPVLAFADKILSPGEIYVSVAAGEKIACSGEAPDPGGYSFMAQGESIMTEDEMRDESRCTGVMDSSTGAMLRAKRIAISNGQGVQCPQGFRCEPEGGSAMQYRPRGTYCTAYAPFRAIHR